MLPPQPAFTDRLHREIPSSCLVDMPNAGHFIQLDERLLLAATILDLRQPLLESFPERLLPVAHLPAPLGDRGVDEHLVDRQRPATQVKQGQEVVLKPANPGSAVDGEAELDVTMRICASSTCPGQYADPRGGAGAAAAPGSL